MLLLYIHIEREEVICKYRWIYRYTHTFVMLLLSCVVYCLSFRTKPTRSKLLGAVFSVHLQVGGPEFVNAPVAVCAQPGSQTGKPGSDRPTF